jgi:hypothetical protein
VSADDAGDEVGEVGLGDDLVQLVDLDQSSDQAGHDP